MPSISGFHSFSNSKKDLSSCAEVKELKAQAQLTEQKLDSLMTATAKIAKSTKTISGNRQPKSFWENLFSEIEADEKAVEIGFNEMSRQAKDQKKGQ